LQRIYRLEHVLGIIRTETGTGKGQQTGAWRGSRKGKETRTPGHKQYQRGIPNHRRMSTHGQLHSVFLSNILQIKITHLKIYNKKIRQISKFYTVFVIQYTLQPG
jgi:hypothetical protein